MDQSFHEPVISSTAVEECKEETQQNANQTNNDDRRYLTLVVKDEKVFMAHKDVLLKASPFFEKLLKSDTRRNEEGTIRLEMLTAPLMEIILKFIYNGRTQINTEEDAKNVFDAADQLLLLKLKDIAVRSLQQRLSIANCISTYYFAVERQCEDLIEYSRGFIHLNFAKVAQTKEFLGLPSEEIEKWISSDDIAISAEADVFKVILRWIEHDRSERTKQFEKLFRHVRLIFASRDYLSSSVAKSSLVKRDAGCLDRVTQALNWLDRAAGYDFPWQQSPRKSLQSQVIVAYRQKMVLCYVPTQDKWLKLPDVKLESVSLVSCQDKLYAISSRDLRQSQRYEPLFNEWAPLAKTEISVKPSMAANPCHKSEFHVFVFQGEIYYIKEGPKTVLCKYNFDSNLWDLFPAFDWGDKNQVCVVASKEYIYAIGGFRYGGRDEGYCLCEVERFDTNDNTWEKMADVQEARGSAFGTALREKIFIAGGIGSSGSVLQTCEVYNTLANDWQFIVNLPFPRVFGSMVYADEKIFIFGGSSDPNSFEGENYAVLSYDHKSDEWTKTTIVPFEESTEGPMFISLEACPAQLLTDTINGLPSAEWSSLPVVDSNRSYMCVII